MWTYWLDNAWFLERCSLGRLS